MSDASNPILFPRTGTCPLCETEGLLLFPHPQAPDLFECADCVLEEVPTEEDEAAECADFDRFLCGWLSVSQEELDGVFFSLWMQHRLEGSPPPTAIENEPRPPLG